MIDSMIDSIRANSANRFVQRFVKRCLGGHSQRTGALLAFSLLLASGARAQTATDKSGKVPGTPTTKPKYNYSVTSMIYASNPTMLNYQFTPGAKVKFKVDALFDGHFPPFAQPDSPPVHFKAILGYTATVLKVDAEGATVEFVVDSREMYLFKNEIKEDAKIDINDGDNVAVLDGLTSLEDIQKALNATAVLRPDGSVVRILSSSSVKVPFDVGFDIRKLFLMMLPITFPNKPVKPGDSWVATDGLLGSKVGKTQYSDRLDAVTGSGTGLAYRLSQSANSVVEDKLDKTGASTSKDADVYRVLSGKVDLTTDTTFVVPVVGAKVLTGQVKSVHLVMNAVINRKRVKIDPDQPEIPENDPLDVRARMTITRVETPVVATGQVTPGGDPSKQKQKPNAGAKQDAKSAEKAKKS